MAVGPGKYDNIATIARKLSDAKAVIVIVFDGYLGNGFSVQSDGTLTPNLPTILRHIADSIESGLE